MLRLHFVVRFLSIGQFDETYEALLGLHQRVPVSAGVAHGEPVAGLQEQRGGGEAGVGFVQRLRGVGGLRALEQGVPPVHVGAGSMQDPGYHVVTI